MKKILLITALLLGIATRTDARSLVLVLSDGTEVYYLLDADASPVMKFTDGKVAVNADNYTFSGIKKFFVSDTDDPNAIGATTAAQDKPTLKDGLLCIRSGADTQLFTADGRLVGQAVATKDGRTTVNTNGLPAGTYIVKSGWNSFKFTKH